MRSHTNGGYVNLLDECWKMCEKFHTNIVIMYDHVSCKNVGGLHGLFEDQARERGIHLIWIPHDVSPRCARQICSSTSLSSWYAMSAL